MLQTGLAAAKTSVIRRCCHVLLKTSANTKITSGHSDLFWCQSQTVKNPGEWNTSKLTESTCLLFITLMFKKWLLVWLAQNADKTWRVLRVRFLQFPAGGWLSYWCLPGCKRPIIIQGIGDQHANYSCHLSQCCWNTHTHPEAATCRRVVIWLLNQSMLILEYECESWKVMTPLTASSIGPEVEPGGNLAAS